MMLSHRDVRVIDFLVSREITKDLVETIVELIPDREFYYPEIEGGSFKSYRVDINDFITSVRKKAETTSAMNLEYIRKEYDKEIQQLVNLKKKLLIFGILLQEEDKRCEILLKLIINGGLQRRILTLKERFRE